MVLVHQRDRPVHKDELLDAVWPGQDVEEGNLPVHISALRKLLGPQAIATVPGQGYRFTLALEGAQAPPGLAAPELPPLPAPLLPGAPPYPSRSHLGAPGAALIGRDADLAALLAALREHRLVSLVGSGGIGKTRLAQAAAQQVLAGAGPQDCVWWIDLADLAQPASLETRVAAAMGLSLARAGDARIALLQALRSLRGCVVLDNCEHLLDGVASLVQAALDGAPGIRWLATTQEPLKLPQEQVMRLAPLALPEPGMTLTQALACGALALLVERARASDRRFALAEADLPAAMAICRQLDGIALALEMAAARLPWMGVSAVQQRLDQRLRMLSADLRLGTPRHRTLQAALEWSHGLLSATEQRVLRSLALFRGGFSLDSASALLALQVALPAWDAIDALGNLVDKSLVQVDGQPEGAPLRYRLLESTRLFALEALRASAELAAAQLHHAQVMADAAQRWGQQLWHQPDGPWLAAVQPDEENLFVALDSALAGASGEQAVPLLSALHWIGALISSGLRIRGYADQVLALAQRLAPQQPVGAAAVLAIAGAMLRNVAPARAQPLYQRALALLPAQGHEVDQFRLNCGLASGHARLGEGPMAAAALARAQRSIQPSWPARLRLLESDAAGFVAALAGDHAAARGHFKRFRDLALHYRMDSGLTVVSHNLVDMALAAGDWDEAILLGRELVLLVRRQHNDYNLGFASGNLFAALVHSGAPADAAAAGAQALGLLRREDCALWLFDHFAAFAWRCNQPQAAALLLGYGDAQRQHTGLSRDPGEQRVAEQLRAQLAQALSADELRAAMAQGAQLDAPAADALALAVSPANSASLRP